VREVVPGRRSRTCGRHDYSRSPASVSGAVMARRGPIGDLGCIWEPSHASVGMSISQNGQGIAEHCRQG
jgi:hypothetical protein